MDNQKLIEVKTFLNKTRRELIKQLVKIDRIESTCDECEKTFQFGELELLEETSGITAVWFNLLEYFSRK